MNAQQHVLEEIEVEQFQIKEVLRCLLHTILFTRALGPVTPTEYESDLFDICYARCGSIEVDKTVEEGVQRLIESLEPVGPDLARGSLVLSFYENRKKSFLGLTSSTERVFWEQWTVPVLVNLRPRAVGGSEASALERERRQAQVESALRASVLLATKLAGSKTEHIPPINFGITAPITFPYEIKIARPSDVGASWFSRLLTSEPPRLS
mmetsp:Transcript_23318/g.65545  ORF Transcript_23318/g.65545 Transcript_23318/m.65545 type:complete len:209 (+) Transcript_23318:197-823(+)